MATAPETQIFAYYLVHFQDQWEHEHRAEAAAEQGGAGLSRLLSEEEFYELCRVSARYVLDRIAAGDPRASWVVEKSPKHALQVEFIHRLFPEARFLHVIRDPRDTVASLLSAGRSWGRGWAPKDVVTAARWWRDHVESARRLSDRSDRYREVTYESLKDDPVRPLMETFSWLGIPTDREAAEAMVEACRFERLQESASGEDMPLPGKRSPSGFFRKGKVGGWRTDLSRTQVRAIETICEEAMAELGYERTTRARSTVRIAVHDLVRRVRESIDWQLARLTQRI